MNQIETHVPLPVPKMFGTVTPPADLHAAARASLNTDEAYQELIKRFGSNFTPSQLVQFIEGR